MKTVDNRENFNHKLDSLITIWQEQNKKDFLEMPTHADFLDLLTCLYRKPHEYHVNLFLDYQLTGKYTGCFPDRHSQAIKDFFAPLITLWHELTNTPESILPVCEDFFFLAEAISRCSAETYNLIFVAYHLSGVSLPLEEIDANTIRKIQTKHRSHNKQELTFQYQTAKRRWRKIPLWVILKNQLAYPYK